MAVVGIHGNDVPFIMDLDTPTNAELIQQTLKESEAINLYPEEKVDPVDEYFNGLNEAYEDIYAANDNKAIEHQYRMNFLQEAKCDFLTLSLYQNLVRPVQEQQNATTREKDIAMDALSSLVHEEGVDNLLEKFRYRNVYLAEMAYETEKMYNHILECMDNGIKEGLSEKDCCEIEDHDIKKYLIDCSDKVPKDISNIISKRVEAGINDFIDDKKKGQAQIKQIYDKAKEKVDQYNQAQQAMNTVAQTDAGTPGSEDPELNIDANLNSKLEYQQNQDIMNQSDPNAVDPTVAGNEPGVGLQTPQQEAMAYAKSQESEILESSYGVFDAMLRVLVESTHKTASIRQQYLKEDGKVDFQKIFNDTKAMYTVLEAVSTLNVIPIDADYIKSMIHEMYINSEENADKTA